MKTFNGMLLTSIAIVVLTPHVATAQATQKIENQEDGEARQRTQ